MTDIPSFIKWAGGKKQLLSQFEPLFPKKFNSYYEPFVGGGAVAFYILKTYKPKAVYLSDSNDELINCYKMIRDNVEELILQLKEYKKRHSKETYYKVRAENPNDLPDLLRATRFVYLNKTCFNGLYRVNSKGEFNVPIGSYKNPAIFSETELWEISMLLKGVKLETKSFYKIDSKPKKGDFVYFDPPYYPIKKDSFTTYTKEAFLDKEQEQLAGLFKRLAKKGVNVMLSNSDSEFIHNLYDGYNVNVVKASRMINCDVKGRGKINELVVTYYAPHQSQL